MKAVFARLPTLLIAARTRTGVFGLQSIRSIRSCFMRSFSPIRIWLKNTFPE